ncbi:receptor-like protein 6 [Ziziphus jujuba]|uniref:Receptor-like protein 6 n=1 Tax=Ziziphus jujuba TaxID=326968 RepID=A0ABM4A2T1_ZIZJJ|nr:receptor-like protein 6 [Ziziphus jujuba]
MEISFFPFILSLLQTTLIITSFFHCAQPLCHSHERSAFLQFKNSLVIDKSTSADPLAYPKVESWSREDCCFWDGIQCDKQTGHVTEVDLSSSCLFGSIKSTSSLFHLTQLQSLNLAYNHFNYSQIPSAIEISKLSKLLSLNLALNVHVVDSPSDVIRLLELKNPGFGFLLQNLTKLRQLALSYVDISSTVPYFLSNFSSLTSIYLRNCGLYGKFPESIFQLPNLEFLSLAENKELTGSFPEFQSGSPLKELSLWHTSFSGDFSSIGELDSLDQLDLEGCKFSGLIPSSIGLGRNELTGQIPPWLANLTQLTYLGLEANRLNGMVPRSFSGLKKLETLYLNSNELSGIVDFDMFLCMENLIKLQLTDNNLSFLTTDTKNINATVPQFRILGLALCNLRNFPSFLSYQDNLMFLELGANKIYGQIPKWVWNISSETMVSFDLSNNFLTGFDQPPTVLPWVRLKFEGRIPPSLPSCMMLQVLNLGNNQLTDIFPSWLGPLPDLKLLVLRSNRFHGVIGKPLFGSAFPSLRFIDLSYNNFTGMLPSEYFQYWNFMKHVDASGSTYMKANSSFKVPSHRWTNVFPYSVTITIKGIERVYEGIQDVLAVIDLFQVTTSMERFQSPLGVYKGFMCLTCPTTFSVVAFLQP